MQKSIFHTTSQFVFIAIFGIALAFLPLFRIEGWAYIPFLQLGQSMLLLALMMGVAFPLAAFLIRKDKAWVFQIKALDCLLFLVIAWAVINAFFLQETASQSYRLFDLIGLVMFYLAVRIFFKKENHFLLLVLLII
ncbi:MAG: hypothetical protein ACXIU2_19190, partial [Cyclobacteriaceae bacterium]